MQEKVLTGRKQGMPILVLDLALYLLAFHKS